MRRAVPCLLLLLAGCAQSSTDAQVERILGLTSGSISSRTPDPARALTDPPRPRTSSLFDSDATNENPPTVNPPASEISFEPAKEAAEVSARLDAYAREGYETPFVRAGQGEEVGVAPDAAPNAAPVPATGAEAEPLVLDLREALKQAQRSSREYLTAEEDYILAAINLLVIQNRWSPRIFNDLSAGLEGSGSSGNFDHTLSIINTLRLSQRLPFGGTAEARLVSDLTRDLRTQASGSYSTSSALVLSARVPLLRGAGSVAREDIIQAQRDVVYRARGFERERRRLLVSLSTDYFQLVQSLAEIQTQRRRIEGLEQFRESTEARFQAGRVSEFEVNTISTNILAQRANLAELREQFQVALERFRVRLGLDAKTPVVVKPIDIELQPPALTQEQAAAAALEYRLDLQNLRDQVDDARRDLDNARNNTLPDLNLDGSVTMPTRPGDRSGVFSVRPRDLDYSVGATLSLPLDRAEERLGVRTALIGLERAQRGYEQARDNAIVNVRSALRRIDLARFRLQLAEERVTITRRRLEEQTLKQAELEAQRIIDSTNAVADAENELQRARTALRTAILNFLLESDQLRVSNEGDLELPKGL
ncbi:MAG: TolC family protein [Planctomycetota bacterium]|nr:TolC family protein [Planctomycetota bacterium]